MSKEHRLSFASDYMEGAHPLILERLQLYGRTEGGPGESLRLLKDREICRYSGEAEWEYRAKVLMKLF